MTTPPAEFPGAVGITALHVQPWEAADGLCGGSPHMHLCCTEGYVVIGGAGRVQTLTANGFAETRPCGSETSSDSRRARFTGP